jgi:hypothetical protein
MQIDLLFFEGCPHAMSARARLREALARVGAPARWNEWDTERAATPEHFRGYSSPTVLVNGVDVERKSPTHGAGCAVGGGPSIETLVAALLEAKR